MKILISIFVLAFTVLVLIAAAVFLIMEANDRVEVLRQKAPWFVKFIERRESLSILVCICIFLLLGNGYELITNEAPEVPSPPNIVLKAPPPPPITIKEVAPPVKMQCWVRNYGVPAISAPPLWGMATILCNTTIKPPYSVELDYDQSVTVGPFTFPVGSEFSKSAEFNHGSKIVAMFDLHTIIPNEPFSIMANGSREKFPLVKAGVIRAKGLALDLHP
jgi:hypothetical protein